MKKLTPNLIVDSIEEALPFWTELLHFDKTVEVPHGDAIGFVILNRDNIEVMLQSRASLASDVPEIAAGAHRAVLYIEVPDLAPIQAALTGWPRIVADRTTPYGAREIIVKAPSSEHVVFIAAHLGG